MHLGDEKLLFFRTNLMIDQNIDLSKLQNLLKNHVYLMHWHIDMFSVEDQDVAPLNAILDQLDGREYGQSCNLETSEDHGMFSQLSLPKELLLKSHWVERLGGKEELCQFGSDDLLANVYHDHESGLSLVGKIATSEDDEDTDEEEVDSDQEEDEEESSDK